MWMHILAAFAWSEAAFALYLILAGFVPAWGRPSEPLEGPVGALGDMVADATS